MLFLHSCFKANDNIGHDGRCTGSANCSACTTCSRCGHCGAGGTCGACTGSSLRKSKPKKHKKSESYASSGKKSKKPPKIVIDEVNINIGSNSRYIARISQTIIYKEQSKESNVIARVPKNTKFIILSKKNSWYRVKVKDGKVEKVGYVYYKDVNKKE